MQVTLAYKRGGGVRGRISFSDPFAVQHGCAVLWGTYLEAIRTRETSVALDFAVLAQDAGQDARWFGRKVSRNWMSLSSSGRSCSGRRRRGRGR